MKALITLWKFSRPHTIVGSVISIFTLYYIVCAHAETNCIPYLILALCIGITCNICIVGINQIADIPIDKINKPYLPIPSGALSVQQAKVIVCVALLISLALALYISPWLFAIVALATGIGWAYSMPPLYLKQHHVTAALSIATVRGLLLNAGGFLVFNYLVNGSREMPENVQILTLFIIVFSVAISWFKDLPDIAGDKQYHIQTFALRYGSCTTLIAGNILVGAAYLLTIALKARDFFLLHDQTFQTKTLFFGHILLLCVFIAHAFSVRLQDMRSVKKYYMRFWCFFFAEYALYLFAYMGSGLGLQ